MIRHSLILILMLFLLSCNNTETPSSDEKLNNIQMNKDHNLLETMSNANLQGFKWMNAPEAFQFSKGSLKVTSGGKTDFFNNPENNEITANAPYLYKEIKGDFVATTLVQPDFSDIWNACSIVIHMDTTHWIKLAFENSDATGKSIVTVVTNGISDDANGAVLTNEDSIWLRIIKKENVYALHWSKNGMDFKMARLSAMPVSNTVKVGIEAQCPAGQSAEHAFLYFSIDQRTIMDLRKGL